MPDHESLPELCYLPLDETPTVTSSDSQQEVDDYQPRAQAKTLALDDSESIKTFSKTFVVEEKISQKQVPWTSRTNTVLKNRRKKAEKTRGRQENLWWLWLGTDEGSAGAIAKLTVPVQNFFLGKHPLVQGKMKKAEKVNTINAWLACKLRIPQDTTR